jgi:hypothetical protein
MNIVLLVTNFLKKEKKENKMLVPDGYCPNCWGKTEYGGKFYEAVVERKVSVNKKSNEVGWIQDYVEKNLRGIVLLKKEDKLVCPNCKISYKPEEVI